MKQCRKTREVHGVAILVFAGDELLTIVKKSGQIRTIASGGEYPDGLEDGGLADAVLSCQQCDMTEGGEFKVADTPETTCSERWKMQSGSRGLLGNR